MATRPYAASTLPCFTGKTIHDGRFLLLAELGAGAFGKVYQALDTAITHRHPANSKKETLQKREANLHRLVSDLPNVVTFEGTLIYDDKYAYMVLDYVAGGDLYKAEERIRKAFLQIVDGVLGCHARGNILISEDGEHLFVTDFGLATKEKFSSAFGCGSAHYMSPVGYDSPANDVWSLGVILVNMATGRNPWYILFLLLFIAEI
ncbi:kinase-like domain-containing protein [Flagelloscypha sp. PMI_526]|nr:kinase-like domain-containing protein [Flagelloscypha sp. PMI_526]